MKLTFADTMNADRQDRVCSILVSLSMLSDTAKRRAGCNGSTGKVYQRELEYHYERAVMDTLRLLGTLIGHSEIASTTNVERIRNHGHSALMDILEEYESSFDMEGE